MTTLRHVAVIDIGKTNAKVAVVDLQSNTEIAVRKQANHVLSGAPYPHYDVEKIWVFILSALSDLQRETSIDAISVTTHGATAALLDDAGCRILWMLSMVTRRPLSRPIGHPLP